ncbi:MAG: PqqD family protein [Pseudarcicella sp.]|nr:PqqD family protein [Pseudarcicella sp.]
MIKYKLSENQMSSALAGETVILNHKKGIYYGLNEVGACIWETLESTPSSASELLDVVVSEFEIDKQTAENDINVLIEKLLKEKLIEVAQ